MVSDIKLVINLMKHNSIRFQIFLWYSISFILATSIIFASFLFVTRQTLYRQVDQELTSHVTKLAEIATRNVTNLHEIVLQQDLFKEFSEIPGMIVVVLDQNGNVIRNSLDNDTNAQTYSSIFSQVKSEKSEIFIDRTIQSQQMRFVADPIFSNDAVVGAVLVGHPTNIIQRSLISLFRTLILVFGILIIPAILSGYIVAGRAMRPIIDISDKIENISSERLNERVSNPNTGDELETLAVSFNRLIDRLQESFTRERQFIGDVAHELKTPISILRGEVELVLAKPRTSREYLQAFRETMTDINKLSTLVKNILDLAWLNTDNAQMGNQSTNISNIALELVEITEKLGAEKNITLKSAITDKLYVNGSEDKLSRALLNVLDNAVKYTPEGKSIS